MDQQQPDSKARLEVKDKRLLFQSLLAMTERLFYLNQFPVDQVDFALSVLPADEEAAIRLIRDRSKSTISWVQRFDFKVLDTKFYLHVYPGDGAAVYRSAQAIFPNIDNSYDDIELDVNNKYAGKVMKWAKKQLRLEDQLTRTAKVLKAIVHSCNTVGQYKRVSPELVTFLPEKYRLALQDYTKTSPYPALTVEPHEIDDAINTLAFAALQPEHKSETDFVSRPKYGRCSSFYSLADFPSTQTYRSLQVRQLQL